MVNAVNDGVMKELTQAHGVFWPISNRKFHDAFEIRIRESRQKLAHVAFDLLPARLKRVHGWVVGGLEGRTAGRSTAAIHPPPLGAEYVHQRIAHRPVAAGDGPRELLVRSLRKQLQGLG